MKAPLIGCLLQNSCLARKGYDLCITWLEKQQSYLSAPHHKHPAEDPASNNTNKKEGNIKCWSSRKA